MVVLLATAGYDYTIRFWDASSGACYRTLQHPEKQVNALQITPDKQYIAAGGNPVIRLYDVNSKTAEPLVTYEGHTASVTALGFQRDGRWMYSSSEDGTVKIWDLRAPTFQRDYECRSGASCVALHANQGELIAGDHSGAVRVFDLTANRCSAELVPEGDTPISSVTVAADASLVVAANYNGNAYFWVPRSADEYSPVRKLAAHRNYITSARLSPDVRLLATTSADRSVKLWNTADGSLVTTLAGHGRWVWDAVFSADSCYLVTGSSDMSAKLWEVASASPVRTYAGHHKAVTAVALNDAAPVPSPSPAPAPAAPVHAVGTGGAGPAPTRHKSSRSMRANEAAAAAAAATSAGPIGAATGTTAAAAGGAMDAAGDVAPGDSDGLPGGADLGDAQGEQGTDRAARGGGSVASGQREAAGFDSVAPSDAER